jgi:hypothetical protein
MRKNGAERSFILLERKLPLPEANPSWEEELLPNFLTGFNVNRKFKTIFTPDIFYLSSSLSRSMACPPRKRIPFILWLFKPNLNSHYLISH